MRTGDLMRRDPDGFYAFVERIGDTFRWKGENVSTGEVAEVLRACPGVAEAVVYGVPVPGAEGRAGMALLNIDEGFDLNELARRLGTLPPYSRPLFLRLAREVVTTETFKPKRRIYVEEGFDPKLVRDPIWVFDRDDEVYVLLDTSRYEAIRNGDLRL